MSLLWHIALFVYVFIAGGFFMIASLVDGFTGTRGFKAFVRNIVYSVLWPFARLIEKVLR